MPGGRAPSSSRVQPRGHTRRWPAPAGTSAPTSCFRTNTQGSPRRRARKGRGTTASDRHTRATTPRLDALRARELPLVGRKAARGRSSTRRWSPFSCPGTPALQDTGPTAAQARHGGVDLTSTAASIATRRFRSCQERRRAHAQCAHGQTRSRHRDTQEPKGLRCAGAAVAKPSTKRAAAR